MQTVVKAVPEVLLCIGGTGPLGSVLEKQVAEAGLGRSIRFLGYIPEKDLPDAYRAADFNVVPSVALEGFGLVAAEALAAGTPSLVTPVGGLPEVVAPLSAALVFRSSAVKDVAEGLIGALRGRDRFPDDVACRDYANRHFALTDATARIAAVYRELLV
jgi:glycosyltransferase involved in cell wall biosynthesis